jgi:hypothetical protein
VAKGIMLVESDPADPGREDEYNEWYRATHLPEVLAIPGFVSARRYRVREEDRARSTKPGYLAVYELEADDLGQPLAELGARLADGRMRSSDTVQLSPPPVVSVYELID